MSAQPERATLYNKWPSGRIEVISGAVLENIETGPNAGVRMRYHDWETGVTAERFFPSEQISNFIVTQWNMQGRFA